MKLGQTRRIRGECGVGVHAQLVPVGEESGRGKLFAMHGDYCSEEEMNFCLSSCVPGDLVRNFLWRPQGT